jgi:hypothetical protein
MNWGEPVLLGAKIFGLIGLAIYVVFAGVVLVQVGRMTDTLEVGFETVIKLMAWLHFAAAIGTLLVALVIL